MSRAARLGAFIFVTLAILVAGIFIIGGKKYLFSSTYQLKTQFENVQGLEEGADVRVGGVHSGTVTGINLPHQPGEKITVMIDLDQATHDIIKKNSIATIETEGLLGNQYLAVSFGSAGSGDVRDGDTIASRPPLEMAELLQKTNGILDSSQQAVKYITQTTANLDSISTKIDKGQGTVGALVNDKQLYTSLENTTTDLQKTMVAAQAGVTDFQENMEAMKHNFLLRGFFKNRGYEDSAELTAYEVERLPPGTPIKEFDYSSKQLFDKQDSAKLKNQKSLNAGGEFLAKNQFGFAVIAVSSSMEGDSQKDLQLTEARAFVVRDYLVDHFGFNDTQLKTLGLGKQPGQPDQKSKSDDWGTVQILIYPPGTEVPPAKSSPPSVESSQKAGNPPAQTAANPNPQ